MVSTPGETQLAGHVPRQSALEQRHADRQRHGGLWRGRDGGDRSDHAAAQGARRRSRSRPCLDGGMVEGGRPRRENRRRGRRRRQHHHRRQPVHAGRQLLLQRRTLHPAGRGEARGLSQGAALLPGRDGAAASRHRARRGAVRGPEPSGLVRQRPRARQAADRGAVRRHGQRQGNECDLRRSRLRQARHQHARNRRAGPVRAAAAP